MKKRFFVEILKEICAEENLQIEIFSHEWQCKITDQKTGKFTWTEGYNFNLNSAVNYITLYDKVSTSIILSNSNIPNVEHHLILKEGWRKNLEVTTTWQEELQDILKKTGENIVLKFANGSQGMNIYRCTTKTEIENLVELLKDKSNLAISKYYESELEYRFYILKGQTLFAYKKIKSHGGWKHNLSQGAIPVLIDKNFSKYLELENLAKQAFNSFGLEVAAIDILDTNDGLKVLEINNGIMMDNFASTSEEYYKMAKDAHRKMLFASLNI